MHGPLDRRTFLGVNAAAAALPSVTARATTTVAAGPIAIASSNGARVVERAVARMLAGADPLVAAVDGVGIIEADPNDMSVGFGGLPNEDGIVELDASVMHGPTHKAGSVAALRNIMHPARLALDVCRRTEHVMIVGDGALRFARSLGYEEQDLLTDASRRAWQRWRANLNPNDVRYDDDQFEPIDVSPLAPAERDQHARADTPIPFTYGTVHCSAMDANGDLGGVTTTSGWSFKIPGRVGDSPIVGAGMFVDNEVGAAGATGRGESVIQAAGAFQIVQHMERGDEPTEACLKTLRWIARHTKRKSLLNADGSPNINVVLYALRKDGATGGACMHTKQSYCVGTPAGVETIPCVRAFG
ncbi:MAG: N(4)-(beta-N-acetylglucosaminyl)-L-asparaginase [Phycisphaerales bacterium]|nr:N(4)-(beta-N-acetylglucosaminyl)-L-asparaginase [Phycisphaerales bacterium]